MSSSKSDVVVLREDNEIFGKGTRFKITARYTLRLSPSKSIGCVRVRQGASAVYHFESSYFERLFKPLAGQ